MDKYEDMLYMANHKSLKHPHMSMIDRAAQFSPFAALSGHNAAIIETARITDEKVVLDESTKELIRDRLQLISVQIEQQKFKKQKLKEQKLKEQKLKVQIVKELNKKEEKSESEDLIGTKLNIAITYYQPDNRKIGGKYLTETGRVRKIDDYKQWIVMDSGLVIPLNDIRRIDGKLFE